MDTINVVYDGTTIELKNEESVYLRIPEINIHIVLIRDRNIVTVEQLDVGPVYVEQKEYVSCALDTVLSKISVHKSAQIFLRCEKVQGQVTWKKNANDFLSITYDSLSSKHRPNNKRKYFAK